MNKKNPATSLVEILEQISPQLSGEFIAHSIENDNIRRIMGLISDLTNELKRVKGEMSGNGSSDFLEKCRQACRMRDEPDISYYKEKINDHARFACAALDNLEKNGMNKKNMELIGFAFNMFSKLFSDFEKAVKK